MWLLPSPARAMRARPLPGQRLSIFLDLGARASKKVEHWRARLCGKQRKSTASGQGEGSGRAGRGAEGQGKALEGGFNRWNTSEKQKKSQTRRRRRDGDSCDEQ